MNTRSVFLVLGVLVAILSAYILISDRQFKSSFYSDDNTSSEAEFKPSNLLNVELIVAAPSESSAVLRFTRDEPKTLLVKVGEPISGTDLSVVSVGENSVVVKDRKKISPLYVLRGSMGNTMVQEVGSSVELNDNFEVRSQ